MKKVRLEVVVAMLMAVLTAGCSWRAEQLKSQPLINSSNVSFEKETDKSFLVYAFDDLRGAEYAYHYPTSFIPPVMFFHVGSYNKYPGQAGILIASRGGRTVVSVGALDTSIPYLLCDMMRDMKLTVHAAPTDSVNTSADLASFDYVVKGKINKTKFSQHANPVPLACLSILGVPFIFTSYSMEIEVSVFSKNDVKTPLMQKTYTFKDSTPVGLYYNQSAAFDMFIAGLEERLPDVVKDISVACE